MAFVRSCAEMGAVEHWARMSGRNSRGFMVLPPLPAGRWARVEDSAERLAGLWLAPAFPCSRSRGRGSTQSAPRFQSREPRGEVTFPGTAGVACTRRTGPPPFPNRWPRCRHGTLKRRQCIRARGQHHYTSTGQHGQRQEKERKIWERKMNSSSFPPFSFLKKPAISMMHRTIGRGITKAVSIGPTISLCARLLSLSIGLRGPRPRIFRRSPRAPRIRGCGRCCRAARRGRPARKR